MGMFTLQMIEFSKTFAGGLIKPRSQGIATKVMVNMQIFAFLTSIFIELVIFRINLCQNIYIRKRNEGC